MEESSPLVFQFFALLSLLATSACLVAIQHALLNADSALLKNEKYRNLFGSYTARRLIADRLRSVTSLELYIFLLNIIIGWSSFPIVIEILSKLLFLNLSDNIFAQGLSFLLSLAIIVTSYVFFSDLIAKSLAHRNPENILRFSAPIIFPFFQAVRPIVLVLEKFANQILKLFGLSTKWRFKRVRTVADLDRMVSEGEESGVIASNEKKMIRRIFSFADTVAREIMTPHNDLVTIPLNSGIKEVLAIAVDTGFSRFPVIGESVDDLVGILLVRDLLPVIKECRGLRVPNFHLQDIMRDAYFVPQSKPVGELLNELRKRRVHMAIVLDEHGCVGGVVTLEDLVEEIVGDILDELDDTEQDILVKENGDIVVDGGVLVADLNQKLFLKIPEGRYDTIAGYIFAALGRLPQIGEELQIEIAKDLSASDDLANEKLDSRHNENTEDKAKYATLIIDSIKGHRIEQVILHGLKYRKSK